MKYFMRFHAISRGLQATGRLKADCNRRSHGLTYFTTEARRRRVQISKSVRSTECICLRFLCGEVQRRQTGGFPRVVWIGLLKNTILDDRIAPNENGKAFQSKWRRAGLERG